MGSKITRLHPESGFAAETGAAVAIFIAPASFEQLRERLQERGVDDAAGVERRLAIARTELAAREEFRFVVVNDEFERAVAELDAIYVQYAE